MITFSCSLLPHQLGSNIIKIDYNREKHKTQTLFMKKVLGKPKDNKLGWGMGTKWGNKET